MLVGEIKDYSNHDKTIKVGDIVTGRTDFPKGYHRVVRIERRFYGDHDAEWMRKQKDGIIAQIGDEYNPLFYIERIVTATGKKSGGYNTCDAVYCQKITKTAIKKMKKDEMDKIRAKYKLLESFIEVIE